MVKIGIIGGSGLDNPDILKNVKEIDVKTPYGNPSSALKCGKIGEKDVILIARHGRQHTITPTNVNNRANIQALFDQGVTHIIATTAVGSLKEEIRPGDLVIINQFIDFTKKRHTTFYDEFEPNKQMHQAMAKPFDEALRKVLKESCDELKIPSHLKGTVVTIEGPRFSTIAESKMFQLLGANIINMSTAPECALANEKKFLM